MSSVASFPNQTATNVLGGPFNGFSPQQTITNFKSSENVVARRVLTRSWNTRYATGSYNGHSRIVTPFRAVNNSGDFLGRVNYSCGGSNQVTIDRYKRGNNIGSIWQNCDSTGVPASICNPRFVADSSDYTKYRKYRSVNQNFNDVSNGGDKNNASYVPAMSVTH